MKRIVFVILTWNSERYIQKCLESILGLCSIKPYIVIIDNGSYDSTKEIVDQFIKKYDHQITLFCNTSNLGTTVTRNKGLREAKKYCPDYLCVLDSDTVINEYAISFLVKKLDEDNSIGIVGPKMITSKGEEQISGRNFPTITEKICKVIPISKIQEYGEKLEIVKCDNPDISHEVDYLMSACWLFNSTLVESVGYLDENIFYAPEDAEYCVRVWKAGYKIVFCPEVHIIHEWQRISKQKVVSKHNYEHIKGLLYMFWKHCKFLKKRR